MSDDTPKTDSWSDTSGSTPESGAPSETPSETQNATERVAFCQDCGKPLTQATMRTVGTGVFCEPCLTTRVGTPTATSGYTTVPPYTTIPPQAAAAGEPSPVLAAILGFIPGVGAMYNGQFAKGIVHLVIFAVLVSLEDNVNGIFGLFVAGWIFYMAFEAYHTAVARRDGLPLPNAFGFNDIGERMGFGKGWGTGSARPSTPPVTNTAPNATPSPGYVPGPTAPMGTAPDWVGYIPPTAFAGPPVAPPAQPIAAANPNAPWGHAPYAETYTGPTQTAYGTPSISDVTPALATRRFPIAAIWLIGLGALILIANLLPDWKLTERWWPPVLFAGLSVWTFTRRMHSGARLVCIVRWPVVLMVLAILLALHAAYLPVTFGFTGSVLLIVFGALLLLERTAGANPTYAPSEAIGIYPVAPVAYNTQDEEARSRAAWAAAESIAAKNDVDSTKGGQ